MNHTARRSALTTLAILALLFTTACTEEKEAPKEKETSLLEASFNLSPMDISETIYGLNTAVAAEYLGNPPTLVQELFLPSDYYLPCIC